MNPAERRREIAERIFEVRGRIADAARVSGRTADEILLVGVSKTFPAADVAFAAEAGLSVFGENRVQEGAGKRAELGNPGLVWHLIGPLQSNKAKAALTSFDVLQAIDSVELAERLDRLAGELERTVPILLEVNLGEESTKAGFASREVPAAAAQISRLPRLRLTGLMAIPPLSDSPDDVRPYVGRLRLLLGNARAEVPEDDRERFRELSIGMSGDYGPAIEEGATIVRVGSAIFGSRH